MIVDHTASCNLQWLLSIPQACTVLHHFSVWESQEYVCTWFNHLWVIQVKFCAS